MFQQTMINPPGQYLAWEQFPSSFINITIIIIKIIIICHAVIFLHYHKMPFLHAEHNKQGWRNRINITEHTRLESAQDTKAFRDDSNNAARSRTLSCFVTELWHRLECVRTQGIICSLFSASNVSLTFTDGTLPTHTWPQPITVCVWATRKII